VLQKIVTDNVSEVTKELAIKKLVDGLCCVCRGIPTYMVGYPVRDGGATKMNDTVKNVREMYSKESPYYNVPVDNRLFRAITVCVHNCDICDDELECNDDIESDRHAQ
jgi:hypothetical protein